MHIGCCPLGPTHYLCDFWLTYVTCLSFCYFCKCEATLGDWAVPMAPARFQNQAGCRTPWESGIPFISLCRHKCWRSKGLFLCSLGLWLLWILVTSSKDGHPGPGLDVCLLGLGSGWNTEPAEILCYTSLSSIYTLKSKRFWTCSWLLPEWSKTKRPSWFATWCWGGAWS